MDGNHKKFRDSVIDYVKKIFVVHCNNTQEITSVSIKKYYCSNYYLE